MARINPRKRQEQFIVNSEDLILKDDGCLEHG